MSYYKSPLGWMEIESYDNVLVSLGFVAKKPAEGALLAKHSPIFSQLESYFHKKKKDFSVVRRHSGTPFQNRVWKELESIPYGKTVSYSEIAERIGRKNSVRAVARVIGQNKIALVVPCHRVIGKNGKLTGYAYGLQKKSWLLRHEGR